jgi:hypothetical protein
MSACGPRADIAHCLVVALAGELVAMFGNVISRSLFDISLLWSLEIGELALVVMTFVGGAMPIRGASTWRCMSWFSGCRGAGMPPSMRLDAGRCLRCRWWAAGSPMR